MDGARIFILITQHTLGNCMKIHISNSTTLTLSKIINYTQNRVNFRIYSFLLYLNHANMSHICTYYKGLMLMKKIVSSAMPSLLWYFVTIYRLNLMRMRGISYPLRRFISKFNFKVKDKTFHYRTKLFEEQTSSRRKRMISFPQ